MWPLNLLKRRHWFFLAACVVFLATYSGFISWAKVSQALERLADLDAPAEAAALPVSSMTRKLLRGLRSPQMPLEL